MTKSIFSKNALRVLLPAITVFVVFSTTAMAQVEQHSQVSIQGTGLVTKDSTSDSSPLSQHTTKSGGFLVGYSYQFNSWAGVEGNYGYTQNTLNTTGSFGQSSIRSDFHEITGAFVAHIPVKVARIRPYALAGAGALIFNPTDDARRINAGIDRQAKATFVYGGGVNFDRQAKIEYMVSTRLESPSEQSLGARYESLIRLADSIRAQHETKTLFDLVVKELSAVIPFDAIVHCDESSNKVNWHFSESCQQVGPPPSDIQNEESLARWVAENQKAAVIADVRQETRFPHSVAALKKIGLQSACALPLSTAHRRLGSLVIASQKPNAYSGEEVRFLSLVADQIALAMDDAINFQTSRRAQERLELLLDLTNRIVSTLDLRDLLREITANLRRVMQSECVGMKLPDAEDGRLRIYALDFPESNGLIAEGYLEPTGTESPGGQVFRTGEPMLAGSLEVANIPLAVELGMKSACLLPLTSRNRVLGVLGVGSVRENAFSQDDVTFLTQFARQVAIAVDNAIAYGQISALKDQLAQEKLYLEDEIRSELNFEEIVGKSEALRRVLTQVETVAPTDSTVLIYGETGTGKELIARAVHNLSSRNSNAFVKL